MGNPSGSISPEISELNKAITETLARSASRQHEVAMKHTGSAELRSQQAKLARDFATQNIDRLKLAIQKNRIQRGAEIVWLTPEEIPGLQEDIQVLQTAQTLLSQRIGEFADGLDLNEWELILPTVWDAFVIEVRGGERASLETSEESSLPVAPPPLREELKVISPPVPMQTLQDAIEGTPNQSAIPMPDQGPSLAETLGKISQEGNNE